MPQFVNPVPMNLNDPNIEALDGRTSQVEPGTYDFEIVKVGFGQSRSGNNTLVVTAVITSEGPMRGRQMRQKYVISNDAFALGRMKALTDATGIETYENGFDADSLIGQRFTADVIEDTYDATDKTGQIVSRTATKWVGERPVADRIEANAAVRRGTAPRRPASAATAVASVNGSQARR